MKPKKTKTTNTTKTTKTVNKKAMAETTPSESTQIPTRGAMRIIKRYSNRKLYDTTESRYVTLDDLAQMVRQGVELQVLDNASKDDLTSVTLAQIIFEEEKRRRLLPLSALKRIIQTGGESITGLVSAIGRDLDETVGKVRRDLDKTVGKVRRDLDETVGQVLGRADEESDDRDQTDEESLTDKGVAGLASDAMDQSSDESAPALQVLREWLAGSQQAFEEWQGRLDDQVKKVLEGLSPVIKIQRQVAALEERVRRLEGGHEEIGKDRSQ